MRFFLAFPLDLRKVALPSYGETMIRELQRQHLIKQKRRNQQKFGVDALLGMLGLFTAVAIYITEPKQAPQVDTTIKKSDLQKLDPVTIKNAPFMFLGRWETMPVSYAPPENNQRIPVISLIDADIVTGVIHQSYKGAKPNHPYL